MMDFRTFVDNAESDETKESMRPAKVAGVATKESPAAPSMWNSVEPVQENQVATRQPKPLSKPKTAAVANESVGITKSARPQSPDTRSAQPYFPVGWLVVTAGPGRGTYLALQEGASPLCRDADGRIFLAADESASPFVTIMFDAARTEFSVGKGGDTASADRLTDGDILTIGKTKIRFIAFCDDSFQWTQPTEEESR